MNSVPFHIPVTWKRYPFQTEPPRKGHHMEYPHPPGPPLGALHSSLIMWVRFPGAETVFRSSFTLQAVRPTHGSHDHIKWHSHNSVPQYYFHAKYIDTQFFSAWTTDTYTDSVTEIHSKIEQINTETGSIGYIHQGIRAAQQKELWCHPQGGYLGFQVTGMIEWSQKSRPPKIPRASSKTQKNPWTKN